MSVLFEHDNICKNFTTPLKEQFNCSDILLFFWEEFVLDQH